MTRSLWQRFDVEIVSALLCLLAGALLWSASGCGDNIDSSGRSHSLEDTLVAWLTSQGAVHGTVYTCNSGAVCDGDEEWCFWPDAEDELEALLGGPCHEITIAERAWPALAGCAYSCELTGPGANAHCGVAGCP